MGFFDSLTRPAPHGRGRFGLVCSNVFHLDLAFERINSQVLFEPPWCTSLPEGSRGKQNGQARYLRLGISRGQRSLFRDRTAGHFVALDVQASPTKSEAMECI